jgi:mannose/fructose/N-acetylgalactosamine-specific phosphotransferase system component IID
VEPRVSGGPFARPILFLRSLLLQAGFSDERRQALGFAWAIDPLLARAYAGDAAGLSAARARQLAPFNVQPCAAGLPLGTTAALETLSAQGDPAAAARAIALKASLGAALSGAADALFWGALRPLAAASAVTGALVAYHCAATRPLKYGAALGLLVFNVPALWARWAGVGAGLAKGEGAALTACGLPAQDWIRAARRAAVIAIFAAVWAVIASPFGFSGAAAAVAFAVGAGLGRVAGGPLRLIAAAGLLAAAANAAVGWAP